MHRERRDEFYTWVWFVNPTPSPCRAGLLFLSKEAVENGGEFTNWQHVFFLLSLNSRVGEERRRWVNGNSCKIC